MIYYLLGTLLLLSLALNVAQYRAKKERNAGLEYMSDKLNAIISDRSSERLLLVTAETELRQLLIGTNRLLSYNHELMSDSAKMSLSMRRMLSNVSHDLKTPLTVVLGYIETIKLNRALSSDERDVMLSKVQSKAEEVLALMNKFFDLAKLESGDWQLERRRIHLNEVCRNSMLGYYDLLTGRGLEVSIDIPEAPIYIYADDEAIGRILDNLLSNAVRYGYEGNVIGLSLRQDQDAAYVDVWDKGRGIPETDMDKVFERLYTLEDSRSSSTVGSGLGLTIAKRLTEQMDGKIELRSKAYERTVFTLRFAKPKFEYNAAASNS
ncbi:sensor histidine kinase [Cohnella cholangitidis]|uniref:histidine kinase n=1 Tax=Cohnella cholangitidis TaxID=2598458 RepID=A0A7G5BUN1_9BACL|nr:sensor histidine kinase [Cohnella cholangitidis]QMV40665.1 HAMP domain-containing histidine kinase [Cohnella cholangitidis]